MLLFADKNEIRLPNNVKSISFVLFCKRTKHEYYIFLGSDLTSFTLEAIVLLSLSMQLCSHFIQRMYMLLLFYSFCWHVVCARACVCVTLFFTYFVQHQKLTLFRSMSLFLQYIHSLHLLPFHYFQLDFLPAIFI